MFVSGEPGALVVPGRQGLVAAAPGQPVPAGAERGRMGEQPGGLGDGERDQPRVGGRGWSGRTGAGARVSVRRRSRAAVTAQMARAAMTRAVCRAIAVNSRTWNPGLVLGWASWWWWVTP